MGDNLTLVYQIVGALAIIATLVFLVMSSRVWRWHTIFFGLLVFAGSITFLIYTAAVHKTRAEWGQVYNNRKDRIETLTKAKNELEYGGDPAIVESSDNSLALLRAKLGQETAGRGLTWRHAEVQGQIDAGNVATLRVVEPPLEGEAPEPSGFTSADEGKRVLHAFGESEVDVDGVPMNMPTDYLGDFIVDRVTASTVSIRPIVELTPSQTAAMGRATFWALYETLPQDSHRAYLEVANDPAEEVETDELKERNLFGQPVDAAKLQQIAGNVEISAGGKTISMSPELIWQITHDGAPAESYEVQELGENGIAETVTKWKIDDVVLAEDEQQVLIKFLDSFSFDVDQPVPEGLDVLPPIDHAEITYTPEGLAALARLYQSEQTTFAIGDTLVIDRVALDALLNVMKDQLKEKLTAAGQAVPSDEELLIEAKKKIEEVQTYFVRDLHNYKEIVGNYHKDMDSLNTEIRQLKVDIANIQASVVELESQIAIRTKEKEALTFDVAGFTREKEILDRYLGQLNAQRQELRQAITLAFRQNIALEQQIASRQAEMADEINRRTKELTNAN
jgi:hypothetical protein